MNMLISVGNSFINWIRVLWENKFRISIKYIPRAVYVTLMSLLFSPFILLEKLIFDRRIKETKIKKPIFILGHMRSGTTFLHYVLCQDSQFSFPTTPEVVFPGMFLSMRKMVYFMVQLFLPKKRPMDNMGITPELPNEEELGMANLIPFSPNNGAYFTKHYYDYVKKYSLFKGVRPSVVKNWKQKYSYYLKKIILRSEGKTFVSKNLANFGRIEQLSELFPDAKFIFIYRNPYKVFTSTRKLFKSFIIPHMGFHQIADEALDDTILDVAELEFSEYFEKRKKLKKDSLIEICFEDFVQEPLRYMEQIYQQLGLEGFEKARPKMEKFCVSYANYKADKYTMAPELKEKIYTKLGFVFEELGYGK